MEIVRGGTKKSFLQPVEELVLPVTAQVENHE